MRPAKPCENCGAPKVPGQGQRYCAECKELAQWRKEHRERALAVAERHPCEDCGRRKEPGHGRRVCLRCGERRKAAKAARRKAQRRYCCRMCGVETGVPWATCRVCRLRSRLRRKQRMKLYRERYDRKRRRRSSKAARELRRMDYRLKREREGKPVTRRSAKPVSDRLNGAYAQVSVEPLVPHLERRLSETSSVALGEIARKHRRDEGDHDRGRRRRSPVRRAGRSLRRVVRRGGDLNAHGPQRSSTRSRRARMWRYCAPSRRAVAARYNRWENDDGS
jgi:hypothetical protein